MFRSKGVLLSRRFVRFVATESGVEPKLTDVFIVGGGPAGLTLAAAIKSSPKLSHFKTTLVDAGDLNGKVAAFYDSPPENYTNRVISLTPPSKRFLEERTGVHLMEDRIQMYDGLYVTDGCADATLDMEKDSMACMIEILNVQASLLKRLHNLDPDPKKFDIIDKTKVSGIELSDKKDPLSWPLIKLDNGDSYKARLLIGADGFNSPVRKFSNIQSRGWFYNAFGVVATMKLEYPPYKIRGWQRFLPTGPIAHLPLPENNATLVWSCTEKLSKLLTSIDPEQFTALVNAAFVLEDVDMKYYYEQLENGSMTTKSLIEDVDFRIEQKFTSLKDESMIDENYPPKVESILSETRARFPLKLSHADTYCSDRIALVGDAAHTTHPLAGQGLNMGQGDVEALVDALENAVSRGADIGSLLSLQPFWANRYPINNLLLGMVDKLHKIYSTDFPPMVAFRSLGVNFLNNFPPLKNVLRETLGQSGRS